MVPSVMCRKRRNGWAAAGRLLVCGWVLVATPAVASSPAAEALQRAVALVQDGKLDEAAALAQTAIADRDARPVACSVLGAIRIRQQRYDEAARLLEEAIRLEPRLLGHT